MENAMLGERNAGMHRRPLNPRLQVRLGFFRVRRVNHGPPVEPPKVGDYSLGHETLEQRRTQFIELDEDQPCGLHVSSLLADKGAESVGKRVRSAQSAGRPRRRRSRRRTASGNAKLASPRQATPYV